MDKILVFAGTTEGRRLSEWLCGMKTDHILCVATEYGEQVLTDDPHAHVRMGRLDKEQIKALVKEEGVEVIVDATHPYASVVTDNIKAAAEETERLYLRLDRNSDDGPEEIPDGLEAYYFDNAAACIEALKRTTGNILLTTGSKELHLYCEDEALRERIVARVLPGRESIELCEAAGLPGKRIIAMQGPFTEEMNLAIIHSYDIRSMVSKQSGKNGGCADKERAAAKAGIPLYMIKRPVNSPGRSFAEVCSSLRPYLKGRKRKISLIGCGMGRPESLTVEAAADIRSAGIVFGAKRLLEDLEIRKQSYPYYLAKDIIPVLKETADDAVILFSGDSGFYSGAAKMGEALKKCVSEEEMDAEIVIRPGISSVSNLAALAGTAWDDAFITSVHGKGTVKDWGQKLLYTVRSEKKTFLLLSGIADLHAIGELLTKAGFGKCKIFAGYHMASPEQKVFYKNADELTDITEEGLYSIFILNENAEKPPVSSGCSDESFIRGKVPMTKEEVRIVSISKLGLKKDSVVYDIGSGTGSVAVEMALLSPDITVYAVERKPEAVELIKANAEKFGLNNIHIVEAYAPEGLQDLKTPTHAFIGGTGGNMKEILEALFEKNPKIRVVANAVSYETLQEFLAIEEEFPVANLNLVQIAVTGTRKVASYHMMKSENPIWVCAFEGRKE